MANDMKSLKKLKSMRENVDWQIDKERNEFFDQLVALIENWEGQLPNFQKIFRPKEIDWLLTESVNSDDNVIKPKPLIDFVIRTGYRDEPKVDKCGKPSSRRTTPVHHAARAANTYIIDDLFKIYDRFDVNYTDEFGFTHFHAACAFACDGVIKKFLELGQDPNCLVPETADSPLHLALNFGFREEPELLLRSGADPNLANAEGSTPLHIICKRRDDHDLAKMLFELSNDKYQPLKIDARDELGRTPLQWAVASLAPKTVDVLLDHGADLSSFVFPTENYFGTGLNPDDYDDFDHFSVFIIAHFTMDILSRTLTIVERLKKRGYELDQSNAFMIMQFFAKYRLFEKPTDFEKYWFDDEEFARESKEIKIDSSLSLYDLIWLRPEEAAKLLSYSDYSKLACSTELLKLPEKSNKACAVHLCEIMSRGFFRRWTLDFFLKLTRYQLPILCCEMIIKNLKNEDLYSICLAAEKYDSLE